MDVQLSELIEKIKTEGVTSAREEADKVLQDARRRKDEILKEAGQEANRIREAAKEEASRMEASGRAALEQAARDLILKVRQSIQNISESILNQKTGDALSGEGLEKIILAALEKWDGTEGDLSLLLSEKDAQELGKKLTGQLASRFGEGVEIKPFPAIKAGFRIGTKEGGSYYDFSAAEIAEMLSRLVNPQLAKIVEAAAKES
ncbi:V-type ATP synthase subunit E [Marispirochaeta sp.]|jgi:V/A-type H+/Na+-transporting ATPase subunit E|uniref:V-type ATP synthase subunit E n=1 Tax=Marispirochaeta sp. TaxID=2038653 RepID=UPI0029C85828|nr:V-type ATP synthase subunit E [Marispirochaeta sp.]